MHRAYHRWWSPSLRVIPAVCGAKDYPLEHHICKCGATVPFGKSGGVSVCEHSRPCPDHPRAWEDKLLGVVDKCTECGSTDHVRPYCHSCFMT